MGWSNYRGVLTLGADERGGYLDVLVLFRADHPLLFIPWSDIIITRKDVSLFKVEIIEFAFRQVPSVQEKLGKRAGGQVLAFHPNRPQK